MKALLVLALSLFSTLSFACGTPASDADGEGFFANVALGQRCANDAPRQKQWVQMSESSIERHIALFTEYAEGNRVPFYICKVELEDGSFELSSGQDEFTDYFKDYYGPMIQFLFTKGLNKEVFSAYPVCAVNPESFVATMRQKSELDVDTGLEKVHYTPIILD